MQCSPRLRLDIPTDPNGVPRLSELVQLVFVLQELNFIAATIDPVDIVILLSVHYQHVKPIMMEMNIRAKIIAAFSSRDVLKDCKEIYMTVLTKAIRKLDLDTRRIALY